MKQLNVTPSGYDHVFWAMAMAVALMLWSLTTYAPRHAYLGADALLCAVLVGWLTAMWRPSRPVEETPSAAPVERVAAVNTPEPSNVS